MIREKGTKMGEISDCGPGRTACIGLLAHVDAGKTTLSEQLLYHARALRTPGRVDTATAFLDADPIERQRGITIFSGQARFLYRGRQYVLVDTPGHTDFASEMERALAVLDAAVVVVSAAEGVQGHTEVILRLLARRNIPTLFFINKLDRAGADVGRVLDQLRQKCAGEVVDFSGRLKANEMTPALAEELAALDESLLEQYVEEGYDAALWQRRAAEMVGQRKLHPAFCGAALEGRGVAELLEGLHALVTTDDEYRADRPLSARVYQVRHDAKGGRVLFLKLLSGRLRVKEELAGDKIDEIRLYHGDKYQSVEEAEAGALCAVTGVSGLRPGQTIGPAQDGVEDGASAVRPVLQARALWADAPDPQVLAAFRQLEDEDPTLRVAWDAGLRQLTCHVMGPIQLEVLRQRMQDRYRLAVDFGPCRIAYQETLAAPTVGIGHYEPLRHYAEVHLLLEPGPRGSGITFASACPLDSLTESYQNLIHTHVMEKEHRGALTGAPLTDVRITLLAGRAHLKHTEGGDFRQAVYRAIRQGLAGGESLLLEPYYDFILTAPSACLGRILADIQRMQGSFAPPESLGGDTVIRGRGPVKYFSHYGAQLPAVTQGRGSISLVFGGYEVCRDAETVIAEADYRMEGDRENPPDSVFCAKGAGFTVPWQEVPQYAHIDRSQYVAVLRRVGLE